MVFVISYYKKMYEGMFHFIPKQNEHFKDTDENVDWSILQIVVNTDSLKKSLQTVKPTLLWLICTTKIQWNNYKETDIMKT